MHKMAVGDLAELVNLAGECNEHCDLPEGVTEKFRADEVFSPDSGRIDAAVKPAGMS
jgi:hypothetical protein